MTILLMIVQMLLAIALIGLVAMQTSNSDTGLSGAIGGGSRSGGRGRGRGGLEDQLQNWTKWAAIFFMVFSVLVAMAFNHADTGRILLVGVVLSLLCVLGVSHFAKAK